MDALIDGEEWRVAPSFPWFEASSLGRVRRVGGGPIDFSGQRRTQRCPNVWFADKSYTVHKVVADAFHGPRPRGLEVDHVDGNPWNSRPDNLEYVTHAVNVQRAVARAARRAA